MIVVRASLLLLLAVSTYCQTAVYVELNFTANPDDIADPTQYNVDTARETAWDAATSSDVYYYGIRYEQEDLARIDFETINFRITELSDIESLDGQNPLEYKLYFGIFTSGSWMKARANIWWGGYLDSHLYIATNVSGVSLICEEDGFFGNNSWTDFDAHYNLTFADYNLTFGMTSDFGSCNEMWSSFASESHPSEFRYVEWQTMYSSMANSRFDTKWYFENGPDNTDDQDNSPEDQDNSPEDQDNSSEDQDNSSEDQDNTDDMPDEDGCTWSSSWNAYECWKSGASGPTMETALALGAALWYI